MPLNVASLGALSVCGDEWENEISEYVYIFHIFARFPFSDESGRNENQWEEN